ncbi:hypothetical protein KUCAC02_003720, partial [Chaenocephalus aceratus]
FREKGPRLLERVRSWRSSRAICSQPSSTLSGLWDHLLGSQLTQRGKKMVTGSEEQPAV